MVIYLERGANYLHMVQLMPLLPHHLLVYLCGAGLPGCPGEKAVKRM